MALQDAPQGLPCLKAHAKPALFLAGDGFQRSGVEGAYLSGRAAAQALLS